MWAVLQGLSRAHAYLLPGWRSELSGQNEPQLCSAAAECRAGLHPTGKQRCIAHCRAPVWIKHAYSSTLPSGSNMHTSAAAASMTSAFNTLVFGYGAAAIVRFSAWCACCACCKMASLHFLAIITNCTAVGPGYRSFWSFAGSRLEVLNIAVQCCTVARQLRGACMLLLYSTFERPHTLCQRIGGCELMAAAAAARAGLWAGSRLLLAG